MLVEAKGGVGARRALALAVVTWSDGAAAELEVAVVCGGEVAVSDRARLREPALRRARLTFDRFAAAGCSASMLDLRTCTALARNLMNDGSFA